MRFSLNLRYIFSIYCCQILENIKIIGPYKEEIWTPKHCTCNITTGRQLCPKTFGGRCRSFFFTYRTFSKMWSFYLYFGMKLQGTILVNYQKIDFIELLLKFSRSESSEKCPNLGILLFKKCLIFCFISRFLLMLHVLIYCHENWLKC